MPKVLKYILLLSVLAALPGIIDSCISRGDTAIYFKVETAEQYAILRNNAERIMQEYLNAYYRNRKYDTAYNLEGKTFLFRLSYGAPK